MKPFYQGKLDVFCAIYAVLNGLKITHKIRTLQAREILHETLLWLAKNPQAFSAVLEQQTDYVSMVDAILNIQKHRRPLRVEQPFEKCDAVHTPSASDVWHVLETWFRGGQNRAAVFRFLRCYVAQAEPVNKHWTTTYCINGTVMPFFDCSIEEGGIYSVKQGGFVTHVQDTSPACLCCIEPHTIRLLALH